MNANKLQYFGLISGFLGLAILYTLELERHAVNLPWRDDYQDILLFLAQLFQSNSVSETIGAYARPHADHLTLSSRLWYAGAFAIMGELDFRALTFISSAIWLVVTAILVRQSFRLSGNPIVALVLATILLAPGYMKLASWAMASFAFFLMVAYALLVFLLLSYNNITAKLFAILFAVLATFTLSSGLLIWPVGLVVLCIGPHSSSKRTLLSLWLAGAAMCLICYFTLRAGQQSWLSNLLESNLVSPIYTVEFTLSILGGALSLNSTSISIYAGLLFLSLTTLLITQARRLAFEPMFHLFAFIFLSLLLISFGRSYSYQFINGLEASLFPRYRFLSTVAWGLLLTLLFTTTKERFRHGSWLMLVLAIVFYIDAHARYLPESRAFHEKRLSEYKRKGIVVKGYAEPAEVSNILKYIEKHRIYRQPSSTSLE